MSKKVFWKSVFDDTTTAPVPPATPPPPTAFTQDDVNRIVAKEKDDSKKKLEQVMSELEKVRQSMGDAESLKTQLSTLKNQYLSREDQLKLEADQKVNELANKFENAVGEVKTWQTRFMSNLVQTELVRAATEGDAYSVDQIVSMLGSRAEAAEVLDKDGKPTGKFATQIKWDSLDAQNQPITLQLSPIEAIKRMKDDTARWGNLFKANLKGGLGNMNVGGGGGGKVDLTDPAAYRKNRQQVLKGN